MGLMGASGAVLTSRYELIEYVNDVNREHAEVLVEQNLNGRAGPVLLRDHGQLPDGGRIPWEHPGAPDAEQVQLLPEQLPEL